MARRKFNKSYPLRGVRTPDTDTTRACEWCGRQYPKVQYGRRKFCSTACLRTNDRDKTLQEKYGISLEEYLRLWNKQNGRCAVCQRKSSITLAVEHSHITGTVRGLCCMMCNRDLIHPVDGDLRKIQNVIDFFTFMRDDLAGHKEPLVPQADTFSRPPDDLPF